MKKTTGVEYVIAFILILGIVQKAFVTTEVTGETKEVQVVAHRGASGYAPENTFASFDKAVAMNADYIEIDVQRSKDGKLVVIHDVTVDRTTNGSGYVKDLSFEQLRSLDAGSWKGVQFSGERIPAFEEVLDRYHEKIGIFIELKYPEIYPGIEEAVAQILKERNLDNPQNGNIIIQSFHFESMKKMNYLLPEIPIGVITSNKAHTTEQELQNFSAYADYFNPHYKILNDELAEEAATYGMKVSSWTVRSRETAETLLNTDVDAVITNYPDYID